MATAVSKRPDIYLHETEWNRQPHVKQKEHDKEIMDAMRTMGGDWTQTWPVREGFLEEVSSQPRLKSSQGVSREERSLA